MASRDVDALLSDALVAQLFDHAWNARENAYIIGPTKVGCAVLTTRGDIFSGCNVEHRFRCHDVHAEVNAITNMVGFGQREIQAIAIAAMREMFTPCGGCMDWIMQFAVESCVVLAQSDKSAPITKYVIRELMPFYPR